MPSPFRLTLLNLLSDPEFRNWVHSGAFRKSENYWSDWRRENPQHENLVREAITILLASHVDEEISETEVDQIITGSWERIENHNKPVKPLFRWWWAAASVALLLAGLWIFNRSIKDRDLSQMASLPKSSKVIERINSGTKPILVTLSDSSSVLLLPGSLLRFPAKFAASSREVELAGEAFFEISKNTRKPFFVHTKTVTTRVVGTSFSVRSFDGEPDVSVIVKTGKVSVYPNTEDSKEIPQNAIVLLPDQRLRYNKEKQLMSQPAIAVGSASLPLKNVSFEFVDTPVTAILDSIGHAYGLKMEYKEEDFSKCILTTSLTDTPLPGKLKIICRALGPSASYKISETEIEISAPGCD